MNFDDKPLILLKGGVDCKNCKTAFEGTYCPQCGQKFSVGRLTMTTVISDFLKAVTDTERGLLRTIIELSQKPGPMIENYIQGKRARYFSAAKYTLLVLVIFTLNLSMLENHFGMFKNMTIGMKSIKTKFFDKDVNAIDYNGKEETLEFKNVKNPDGLNIDFKWNSDEPKQAKTGADKIRGPKKLIRTHTKPSKETAFVKSSVGDVTAETNPDGETVTIDFFGQKKTVKREKLLEFITSLIPVYHGVFFDYLRLFSVLWVPIFSLLSFLLFWKSRKNFAEHFTFNTFVFSHMLLIFIVISPLYWFFPKNNMLTLNCTLGAMGFYLIFSYMQFFKGQRRRLIKAGTIISVGLGTYLTTMFSLFAILALYVGYMNLDLL